MTSFAPLASRPARSAQSTVRHIIIDGLLFALVIVTAIGLSGLIGRLIDPNLTLVTADATELALSLAFTLIGGPLAVLLWSLTWRRLKDPAERASLAWGLYLTAASTVALIVVVTSGLTALASLVDGYWLPGDAATALVWLAVWLWHRWMRRHKTKAPLRLSTVSDVIASWYGLIVGAVALAATVASVFPEVISGLAVSIDSEYVWWQSALQTLIWAAGGGLVWWWHWFVERSRDVTTAFSSVALVVVGILAASVATLAGTGALILVALQFGFDRVYAHLESMFEPLDPALAAALVGALVWAYSAWIASTRPPLGGDSVRSAAALVLSGVGVTFTACGIGVIISATLATLSPALAGSEPRTLLLGGISTFVVGAPLWWIVWRPTRHAVPAAASSPGRRIYLVALFGISAVVALVTLLVIGFQIFQFLLADPLEANLVDSIRASLGLAIATALVAGYHFAIWRRDRSISGTSPDRARSIRQVILVVPVEDRRVVAEIRQATGAVVTVWLRTGEGHASAPAAPAAEAVVAALSGLHAERVLVIAQASLELEVIPLSD